ncbi:MAG TPA: copper oxidase [Phycisphaerae bacterium]|nr:copper oxidase [Phycisphaerae bacterium]
MITRREMIVSSAAVVTAGRGLLSAAEQARADAPPPVRSDSQDGHGGDLPYTPVLTPNGNTLPWKLVDGVKVFHLVAEPVQREFMPGLMLNCWGYNGQTPGPTIEVVEGDRVRIYVTNNLPEPTSVHWHGILLPNGMDGVSGLNQKPIKPGETFKYEFTLRQHGTHMYHPHFDEMVQMSMGLMGLFIIHPRHRPDPPIDRDFAIMLTEWRIDAGTGRPNPLEMTEFNILTFNSRAFPGTEPLIVKQGDRVRIRIGNLSAMSHHPIHLHGYQFRITATDGGAIPESAQWPETTVLVPVGSTRNIEFVADAPGDWALHCHMTHHIMNQMGHGFPNMIAVKTDDLEPKIRRLVPDYMTMGTGGMSMEHAMKQPWNTVAMVGGKGPFATIDMGGMMTVLKVRSDITSYQDPGWYDHAAGMVAEPVEWREVESNAPLYQPTTTAPAKKNAQEDHRH